MNMNVNVHYLYLYLVLVFYVHVIQYICTVSVICSLLENLAVTFSILSG